MDEGLHDCRILDVSAGSQKQESKFFFSICTFSPCDLATGIRGRKMLERFPSREATARPREGTRKRQL